MEKNTNKVEVFLEDMSYNTKYHFLTQGANNDELKEIAEKRGMRLPAKDLAVFKGIYGFVDRMNHNGCTLPKEEIEVALDTLIGKAVDFDHLRKRVVGHWIDAKLEGDQIIAYGVFYKGNFENDYDMIQELMEGDCLGISFEAWGEREFTSECGHEYNLRDIEFAGGALLPNSEPAFDGAGVLNMANKEMVLEFASKLKESAPKEFLHSAKDRVDAKWDIYDFDALMKVVYEAEMPAGEEESWREIEKIDFKNGKVIIKYEPTGTIAEIDLNPTIVIKKKGKKADAKNTVGEADKASTEDVKIENATYVDAYVEDNQRFVDSFDGTNFALEVELAKRIEGVEVGEERKEIKDKDFAGLKRIKNADKTRKIRIFPIHDPAHIEEALDRLENDVVVATLETLGISTDNLKRKILQRAKELNMKDLLKKYEEATADEQKEIVQELATKIDELEKQLEEKDTAIEEAQAKLDEKDEECKKVEEEKEAISKDAEEAKAEIARRDKEATDELIRSRREALGEEFAKDMSDEDIADEGKYKIATLEKENAELKDKLGDGDEDEEKKDDEKKEEAKLDKGSKDKSAEDEVFAVRKRVMEKAYGDGHSA